MCWAPRLVHGEAWRQVNLLRLRDGLHGRGFRGADQLRIETVDVTERAAGSGLVPLRAENWDAFVRGQSRRPDFELGLGPFRVLAVRLAGLAGTLAWPTQPGRTFADELKGRVCVIAGLDQAPILLHSEDLAGRGDRRACPAADTRGSPGGRRGSLAQGRGRVR